MTELLFRDDAYLRSCEARVTAVDERGIRLDRTVFYPTGGGQPGDTGTLRLASGETIAIVDTVKGDGPDDIIHVPAPGSAAPPAGAELTRRDRLGAAAPADAHAQLPAPAVRRGAGRGDRRPGRRDGRGRLDFDVPGSSLDKEAIAARLNAADRRRPPGGAALDHRRGIGRAPRAGAHDVGQAARRRRARAADGDRAASICSPAAARTSATPPRSARSTIAKIENKGRQNRRIIVAFVE